jgi:hypothetical protein
MAIAGLKDPLEVVTTEPSPVEETVETTIKMLQRLSLVNDEQALHNSLTGEFTRLVELGKGRLYVRLPAGVKTSQLIELASALAIERGFIKIYAWPPFWAPGTETNSLTEQELDGSTTTFEARLALSATDSRYDPLLHFTVLSFDDMYRDSGRPTQLKKIGQAQAEFVAQHPGAALDTCDQRDYLVWYIMDMIRGVPTSELALAQGLMRVPRHGRRRVDGVSCVGGVFSNGGQASLGRSGGVAYDDHGVGLSVGFTEES